MKKFLIIIYGLILFFLVGCGSNTAIEDNTDNNVNVQKISAHRTIDQGPANDAKNILQNYDEVTGIRAVNTSKHLIIAVEIKHNKRFQLKKIKKKLTEDLSNHFKNFHVELTIDKKIYLEIEKLEKKIQSQSIKPGELSKEIKRITKLSKEKT